MSSIPVTSSSTDFPARPPLFTATLAIASIASCATLPAALLAAEQQWIVVTIAIIAIGATAVAEQSRAGQAVRRSISVNPRLSMTTAVIASIALLAAFCNDHYALLMIATVAIYSAACTGLNLQMGLAGIPNFAGAAFFSIGAYTAAMLSLTALPSPIVLIIGGLNAGLLGTFLILPVLRTRGHYAALVSIAFGLLLRIFLEVNDTFGGPQGLKVGSFKFFGVDFASITQLGPIDVSFYFPIAVLAVIVCALAMALASWLENSWLGLKFDAVRSDEISASAFGISVSGTKFVAFLIGNFVIGVAGALYGYLVGFVNPNSAGFGESLILISIIILGGISNRWGSLVAAVVILVLPEKLHAIQEYKLLIFAFLVILILLFRSGGLLPRPMRNFGTFLPRQDGGPR